MIVGVLAVAGISAWHLYQLHQSGQAVFWLAELWAPSAVLSIGLVSGLDYLMPAAPPSSGPRQPGAKPKKPKPAKARG